MTLHSYYLRSKEKKYELNNYVYKLRNRYIIQTDKYKVCTHTNKSRKKLDTLMPSKVRCKEIEVIDLTNECIKIESDVSVESYDQPDSNYISHVVRESDDSVSCESLISMEEQIDTNLSCCLEPSSYNSCLNDSSADENIELPIELSIHSLTSTKIYKCLIV